MDGFGVGINVFEVFKKRKKSREMDHCVLVCFSGGIRT